MQIPDKPWKVLVDDNFDHGESSLTPVWAYDTLDEAIADCKARVDRWLMSQLEPGMGAKQLYDSYTTYGDDPWILGPPPSKGVLFSAWDYARERCWAICPKGGVQ